jgi:hypothetical protein
MLLNTFLGAIIKLVISHVAISKSICGNLNMRLKKRGILTPSFREEMPGDMPPKFEGPELCLGNDICGFMMPVMECGGSDLVLQVQMNRWALIVCKVAILKIAGSSELSVQVNSWLSERCRSDSLHCHKEMSRCFESTLHLNARLPVALPCKFMQAGCLLV